MSLLSEYFGVIVSAAIISCFLLAVGALIDSRLRQPVERVLCLQATLLALAACLLLRPLAILPPLPLAWWPTPADRESATAATAVRPAEQLRTTATGDERTRSESTTAARGSSFIDEQGPAFATTAAQPSPAQLWTAVRALCVATAFLGGAWYLIAWVLGRWQLAALLQTASPVNDKLLATWHDHAAARRAGVRILTSRQLNVPLTCGIWRPVIVLPAGLLVADAETRRSACLAHEWAHVRRHDAAVWLLVRLLQPLMWYQPLFWRLARELRVGQDQLADHFAVNACPDRARYAELLLSFARQRADWAVMPALSMTDRGSHLRRRVELLLAGHQAISSSARRRVAVVVAASMTTVALLLAAVADKDAAAAADSDQAAPTSAAGEPLSFSGTVIDSRTKQPIVGAEVVVRRSILRAADNRILEESHHTTDVAGIYRFVIPPEQAAERNLYIELDVKHLDYVARKGFGYSLGMIRKNLALGDPPFFTRVELHPSDPVTGRVVDPAGQPLAGVKVRACTMAKEHDWEGISWPLVETDADGRFRVDAVAGGPCIVWIVPDKFTPRQLVLGAKHGDQGELRMEPGVSLSGQVLDASGKPVEGVWVNLEDETAGREIKMPVATSVCRTDLTDAEGRFELGPMKAGPCSLRIDDFPREVKYEDRRRTSTPVRDVFVMKQFDLTPADEGRDITIRALPYVEVRGQFVDSQGKPTSGWEISAAGQVDKQWFLAGWNPNPDGKFTGRLPKNLERGRLTAISNEHHSLRIRLRPSGPLAQPRDLEIGPVDADLTDIEVVKYVAPIVQIAVVDEQGHAVQDANVSGIYDNDDDLVHPVDGLPTHIFFESQSDGRFRTSQMLPDVKTTFTAKADGYDDASASVNLPEAAERKLKLVMKKSEPKSNTDAAATKAKEWIARFWSASPPEKSASPTDDQQ